MHKNNNCISKTFLLILSFVLVFSLFSCDSAENNSDNLSETSKVLSEENHSKEESSATESTIEESEQTSSDEVSKISNDESIATVSSITDIEDFEKLGLKKDDYRYLLIKAFLDGDTATMEEMGGLQKGVFDSYKTLKIGDYKIYLGEHESVFFTFDIIESGMDTMPVGLYTFKVETGMETLFFPFDQDTNEQSPAQIAIYQWRVIHRICDYSDPSSLTGNDKVHYTFALTEYILWAHSKITLEEFQEYAYKISGISDFIPSEDYLYEGLYEIPGRGGITWSHEIIDEKEENGITTVSIQFYADWAETIKSHVTEYKLKQVDDDWVFISSDYIYKSQYEPTYFSN